MSREEVWRLVRARLDETAGPALGAIIDALHLASYDRCVAVVHAPAAHVALARSRAGQIEAAFAAALGEQARVEVRPAVESREEAPAPDAQDAAEAMNHPLVKEAIEVFDARVVRVAPDADEAKESA